jgi:lycopene cyclase domain-containing protein
MNGPWYLLLDAALWLIALGVVRWSWPRLDAGERRGAWLAAALVMVLQVGNEWLSLNVFQAWSFSQAHNRLLGVELWGAPLEEYFFWFAFAWMIPFGYAGLASREGRS